MKHMNFHSTYLLTYASFGLESRSGTVAGGMTSNDNSENR
jgi:hypothetical protein